MLTRAVPLLLVFSLVLFINTEMWQVFSLMPRAYLAAVAGLLALVAGAFLVGRLPREVVRLQGDGPPLNRAPARQRRPRHVRLAGAAGAGGQRSRMAVFFVVFGALTIGPEVRESWIGSSGTAIGPSLELLGGRLTITEELLRVSGAIAAFGGVYYAIAVLTDSTYREEFLDDIVGELRETFAPARRVPRAQRFIATYLISRYSWMPSAPPSRPKPDCLTPPNGAAGLETRPWLRPTMPVSSPSKTRNARLMSLRVDVGDEPVLGVVGGRDRGLLVVEARDRRDRPEDLLLEQARVDRHAGEHRRLVEVARAVALGAAEHHAGALARRVLDELGDLGALRRRRSAARP